MRPSSRRKTIALPLQRDPASLSGGAHGEQHHESRPCISLFPDANARARADAQARTRARAHSSRIFATRLTGMVNSLPFSPASVVFRQVSIERMMHEQSKQRYSLLATSR
jgi:hypothetical protein